METKMESKAAKTATTDPMQEKISRAVPYARAGEQQSLWVCLNGKAYNIPRGKAVELPKPVWEIIDRMLAAERKQQEELRRN